MGAHDPTRRGITADALATRLKTSVRTARRIWAEPRAAYELRSDARNEPWRLEGISRATWFRRRARKKAVQPRGGIACGDFGTPD